MKKTTLTVIASLFAYSTLFSHTALADAPGDGHGQRWQQGEQSHADNRGHDRDKGHDERGRDHDRDYDRDKGHDDRGNKGWHNDGPRADRDHFAWNGHDFRRGHPIPAEYRGDRYRINDWHDRGLREPPRGEHWAYIDGNYVLIAAATGVITSLILSSAFH